MEGKLDFDWLSDPLLLYALSLTALLFGGIFILILTIVIKHSRRLHSEKIQNHFILLIQQTAKYFEEGRDIHDQLGQINALIRIHQKDIAYGWVRLLENTPKTDRQKYIVIATQTNMLECIPHCLNSGDLAEKCIALEAIGLSHFDNHINDVKQYTDQEIVAPYACVALARLIGKESLPQIIHSYEKGVLLTTQALAAVVEIPDEQIVDYTKDLAQKNLPNQITRYLELA